MKTAHAKQSTHVVPQDQAKAMVAALVAIGDELEAKDDPRWYDVARTAAALEGIRLGVIEVAPLYQPRSEVAHV